MNKHLDKKVKKSFFNPVLGGVLAASLVVTGGVFLTDKKVQNKIQETYKIYVEKDPFAEYIIYPEQNTKIKTDSGIVEDCGCQTRNITYNIYGFDLRLRAILCPDKFSFDKYLQEEKFQYYETDWVIASNEKNSLVEISLEECPQSDAEPPEAELKKIVKEIYSIYYPKNKEMGEQARANGWDEESAIEEVLNGKFNHNLSRKARQSFVAKYQEKAYIKELLLRLKAKDPTFHLFVWYQFDRNTATFDKNKIAPGYSSFGKDTFEQDFLNGVFPPCPGLLYYLGTSQKRAQ